MRSSHLPDFAAGVFAPGWDTSLSSAPEHSNERFLASYGLGSPFPEDAKLCAALGSYWPAAAPDATQTLPRPRSTYHTTVPQTDEEVGLVGDLPWDGIPGGELLNINGRQVVRFRDIDYGDYIYNALAGEITLANTSRVDAEEYLSRLTAMVRVYITLRLRPSDKHRLGFISFRKVEASDPEVQHAVQATSADVPSHLYRFDVFLKGQSERREQGYIDIDIRERHIFLVARAMWEHSGQVLVPTYSILSQGEDGTWRVRS